MGWLVEMLGQFGDDSVTRGKISEAEMRIAAIETERDQLREENRKLRSELAGMRAEAQTSLPALHEASGVLWKRKSDGGFESVPYCPTCKSLLSDYSGSLLCLKCNWQAPIKTFEVPRIYHDLFAKENT